MSSKRTIPASELPINADGSVFHLHLQAEQVPDKVVMMGDPERVALVAKHFDSIDFEVKNREFRSIGGQYKGKRLLALSHGIGCDNLDIVVNELDALVNIDFHTRQEKPNLRSLRLVRLGTCGGLQPYCPIGSYVASEVAMGMDGLLHFYQGGEAVNLATFTEAFVAHSKWNSQLAQPYFVASHPQLVQSIAYDMIKGITCCANGFYGPQGRYLRVPLTQPKQNQLLESFEYKGLHFMNYEMESAALAGLAGLMGHEALTVCLVIANRHTTEMNTAYSGSFDELILKVLDRI